MMHHPVRSPGRHPAPGVHPELPGTDAAPHLCPPPGQPRARFRDLPGHIVLQIAERLNNAAALSLGLTSKHAHAALDRARIGPDRFGEQTQWIVSHTDVQRLLERIEHCAAPVRPRLWNALHCAVRRLCSHPPFGCTARSTCSVPLHPAVRERVLASLPPLPPAAPPPPRRALQALLTLGDADRGPSLVAWITHADRDTMMKPGLPAWLDIVARLPPNDAVAVQAMVTERCDARDVAQWRAMLDATLAGARARQGDPNPVMQLQRVRLLNAVARSVARRDRWRNSLPYRWAYWTEVLTEAQHLPHPHCNMLLRSLARGAFHGCAYRHESQPGNATVIKGWRALIDSALTRLAPDDAAGVLTSMLRPFQLSDVHGECAPLLEEVFAATSALPHGIAIGVLEHAFGAACGNAEVVTQQIFWDRLLHACQGVNSALRADCLAELADMCGVIGDGKEARFITLAEQLEALSPELRRTPLQRLARSSYHYPGQAGTVVPRLMALWEDLGDKDRAEMLVWLIGAFPHDAHWRRVLVNTAASLAEAHRYRPLRAIAMDLLEWAEGDPYKQRRTDVQIAVSPADYAIACLPTNWEALTDQLTQILTMLPLRRRGDLLLDLERAAKSAGMKIWILGKATALPPTLRYEVKLITRIAEYAATNCPAEYASILLPLVAEAVATLDDDHRASAWYWLNDACTKFGMPQWMEEAGTVNRLQEPDSLTPTAGRKRKAGRDAQADM